MQVVVVLKGIEAWDLQFSNDLTPINDMFDLSCPNCQAHAGAVQVYQEVKQATNSFATAWQAVQQYGLDYSITGHGTSHCTSTFSALTSQSNSAFGGMVAQVAALDLGWQDQIHWVHSHGSEKVFNQASADLFNSLFEGESAQRTVANEDNIQRVIPAGTSDYTFAGQGFHIFGNGVSNSTYGMSYTVCYYTDDPNCLGGENDTTDSVSRRSLQHARTILIHRRGRLSTIRTLGTAEARRMNTMHKCFRPTLHHSALRASSLWLFW